MRDNCWSIPSPTCAGNFADETENARFPSRAENAEGYFLTRDTMQWFCGHYLKDPAHGADWRVSPLRAKELKGVAPAVVTTAWFDPLRDEGEAYARALQAAGVPVSYHQGFGLIHGYFGLGDASERRAPKRSAQGPISKSCWRKAPDASPTDKKVKSTRPHLPRLRGTPHRNPTVVPGKRSADPGPIPPGSCLAERCGHIALITSTGGDGSRLQVRTCAQGRDDEKKVKPRELPVIAMTLPADTPKPPAAACARVVPTPSRHKRSEGAGNAGCPVHPQPPVQQKSTGVVATGSAGINRHSPRNGFNGLLRALPGDEFVLSPSPVD